MHGSIKLKVQIGPHYPRGTKGIHEEERSFPFGLNALWLKVRFRALEPSTRRVHF
jgi:hypothetical protein